MKTIYFHKDLKILLSYKILQCMCVTIAMLSFPSNYKTNKKSNRTIVYLTFSFQHTEVDDYLRNLENVLNFQNNSYVNVNKI